MPPRARPGAPAHPGTARAARLLLAALLLAVLTVVGSTPAAAGSVPTFRPSAGVPPSAAYPPGAHRPTQHTDRTDRTARTGTFHDTRRSRTATATDHHRSQPPPAPRPQPRAGSDQARTAHHLPPPGPDLLLPPGAPGIHAPRRPHRPAPAARPRATDRSRVTLPGVRGPPWTAVHRPPVLPPVPSR
ncbi:hypothetical protein [Streptomyces sp. NBC_00893]|uniref:hypothetical protein n=1 Tax=Streptomyces sp. NBC_00893 TaxID=2975862 RepID=UPI002251951B|nr:hypothetical protein [Streptomyces sp. NBC_00893]MCX4844036.1 hypothetical protein [Streptomyces sp. NBC_00893]